MGPPPWPGREPSADEQGDRERAVDEQTDPFGLSHRRPVGRQHFMDALDQRREAPGAERFTGAVQGPEQFVLEDGDFEQRADLPGGAEPQMCEDA
ncbi:hypothetical protein ACWDAZ_40940, partial [Streptomyces sp. NPDC001215]